MAKVDIEEVRNSQVDSYYQALFFDYVPPSSKWFNETWEIAPRGEANIKLRIRQLLDEGKKVYTGYCCTSIRGVYDHIIFYK